MKNAAWIAGLWLALGLMIAPSAVAVDAPEADAGSVEAEESCTRDVPPSYCKVGPVVCSFQGEIGCSIDKAATSSSGDPLCTLDLPPTECSVGPVTCHFQGGPSCSVDA